jgi:hypothetical protein
VKKAFQFDEQRVLIFDDITTSGRLYFPLDIEAMRQEKAYLVSETERIYAFNETVRQALLATSPELIEPTITKWQTTQEAAFVANAAVRIAEIDDILALVEAI